MVLSKNTIRALCNDDEETSLVTPWTAGNIQTCSYDLTFSGEYYYYDPKDGKHSKPKQLKANERLYIPAHAICYLLTEEKINMPSNLTASISLSFGLIKSGVMLSNQPPFDPGYHGKTVALLHNLSDSEVVLSKGDHFLNIVFTLLNTQVPSTELYCGSYQGLQNLNEYCKKQVKGAVFTLAQELTNQKRKIANFIPHVLTLITVIITLLTAFITILTASNLFPSKDANSTAPLPQINDGALCISTNDDLDSLTITINGADYLIDFQNETVTNKSDGNN